MRLFYCHLGLMFVFFPTSVRADDISHLFPDDTEFAWSIDIKAIMASPVGKAAIGKDTPSELARKLWRWTGLDAFDRYPWFSDFRFTPFPDKVMNKLDRVTYAGPNSAVLGLPPGTYFLEGDVDENEIAKYWKAECPDGFWQDKIGDRILLLLRYNEARSERRWYGIRLSDSLYLITTDFDPLKTKGILKVVMDKHAGKRRAVLQPAMADWLDKGKPDVSNWVCHFPSEEKIFLFPTLARATATISLKKDLEIRIEGTFQEEAQAKEMEELADKVAGKLADKAAWTRKELEMRILTETGFETKRDGKLMVLTCKIPMKVLAEEYTKQK